MIEDIFSRYVPLIEAEMQRLLADDDARLAGHYGMLLYHMGWRDEQLRPASFDGGKRIRPVVCLLACQAVGGTPEQALPASAALELLHNFSLIHDDIEDDSPTRRHRPTVWALWGRPQAINVGDAMFTLARLALYGLSEQGLPAGDVLAACRLFDETCLRLTEGQYLDMSFEQRLDVTADEYLAMIGGKTAALLSASLEMGALAGGATPETRRQLGEFGRNLGLAFQIQDDVLGIWGDEAQTGKSAESDILTRKKTLPVVFALSHPAVGAALQLLYARPLTIEDVPAVLDLLERAGARSFAEAMAAQAHQKAMEALAASGILAGGNQAAQALQQIAGALLERKR